MNEQELNLTKLSYVNKDFASIYPDLLDLVKILTNRWDPSTSNESDPGVVLLKIGAFLADHLNYNIDKNVLECFLPSATQEESVRRIAEFGGYTPKYYRSAEGYVSISYNPSDTTEFRGFSIPPFTLVVTNDDGSISYTQLDAISINAKNTPGDGSRSGAARFIEGTIQRLTIDTDTITLNNLDNFRRVYFPNSYVAENGVFIYNVLNGQRSSDAWKRTNYLYTQPLGTSCYKIDYDSTKNLPYIEFPTDISDLIGDGLAIYYIYTAGSYGNVRAGELTKIASVNGSLISNSSAADYFNNLDDFVVTNNSSILNGCEPESIQEIYNSYKKVVGTFDTLVSTQDYSNAIRIIEAEGDNLPYISNGLVTDRRNDYNNAISVISFKSTSGARTSFSNVALNVGKITFLPSSSTEPADPEKGYVYYNTNDDKTYIYTGNGWEEVDEMGSANLMNYLDGMSPYDLTIYALQKYAESDYNSLKYWEALSNSFKQIAGMDNSGIIDTTEEQLIAELDEYKCINHTFKDLKDGQVYCFKNYVPLNVDVVPYNKVSKYERLEIINNIRRALSNNFNASKVEFGEELNYDEVKRIIESADSRINYARLSDFDYQTKVMIKDSQDPNNAAEYDIFAPYEDTTFIADLAAKNVIAGRLCLFNFDDNFSYKFGQTNCAAHTDLVSIKSEVPIYPNTGVEYNYTLNQNEFVEIFYPNYYSEKTYGSYVLYNFVAGDPASPVLNRIIPAGVEYELAGDEYIDIYYVDENGTAHPDRIESGTIVRSSFDISSDVNSKQTFVKGTGTYNQIASNESISTRVLMSTLLNTPTYVYWKLNNQGNILFESNNTDTDVEQERILGSDEYIIYTDSSKSNLTIYGRGTRLTRTAPANSPAMELAVSSAISKQQLNDEGLAAKIPFILYDFSIIPVEITEMNIITLGEGDRFKFECDEAEINSNCVYINDNSPVEYEFASNTGAKVLPAQQHFYEVRSRLDINITNNEPMILVGDQKLTVVSSTDGTKIEIAGNGTCIQSNINLYLVGSAYDEYIDISIYNDVGLDINFYSYLNSNESLISTVATTDTVQAGDVNIWICNPDKTEYEYVTTAIVAGDPKIDTWFKCEQNQVGNTVSYTYLLTDPISVEVPFGVIWYEYLDDPQAVTDREYICQLHLSNTQESSGKVKVKFVAVTSGGDVSLSIGHYGNIGEIVDSEATLLNNQSIYVYPEIDSSSIRDVKMIITADAIDGGILTIIDPVVSWGGNPNLGTELTEVTNRITDLLENSSDSSVQLHWVNTPASDLALSDISLADPYALFHHNNVANIITIPEIDLENSNIDIIRAMRNY